MVFMHAGDKHEKGENENEHEHAKISVVRLDVRRALSRPATDRRESTATDQHIAE